MIKKLIYVLLSLVLTFTIFALVGCKPESESVNKTGGDLESKEEFHEMTIEEIRQKTQERFYDENGNLDTWQWENSANTPGLYPFVMPEITGFDVQIIKNLYGMEVWYLVEFEPTGFFYGLTTKEFGVYDFMHYPSPFKLLNIEKDNRYCNWRTFATMRDGELVEISDEAWVGTVCEPSPGYVPVKKSI